MYCVNCGAHIADDAAFCHNCGAAVGGHLAGEASKPAKKPKAVWGRVARGFGLGLAVMAIGIAVAVWVWGSPTYSEAVQETLEEVVALRNVGDASLSAGDTRAMSEVADQLHVQYQRLNGLSPPPDSLEYHTSLMEWLFLLYQASEQAVAQDLKAAGDAGVAAGDYEALQRISVDLEIQHERLSALRPPPKLEEYHFSVIDWVFQMSRAAQQIGSASLSPEEAQIVWGTPPIIPALADIPIDGGLFASIEPQVGPQPGQVFYNVPPNSASLWSAITRLTPSCHISPCYEVPQINPPQPGEVLAFIVGEGGQPITGVGITQGDTSGQAPPPELPPGLPPELTSGGDLGAFAAGLPPELTSGGDLEAFADGCMQVNGIYPGVTSGLSGSISSGYTCLISVNVEDFTYTCSITLYPSGSYDFNCG
jgi:hypothetical protein